ncbi:fluoride efflux transporter FluC [Halorubrum laminariae]|uniref:Fluoride-specific ion channel FluC n=1 Tax=Halorubrum laminariae TaxID=1433523 RepID=A0ABD6BZC4_9EURY|nr:CrcB family protein [Halorubrum laminariae]
MERTRFGYLLVAVGGFVGAAARYGVDVAAGDTTGLGTLAVNIAGSLALGVLVGRTTTTRTQLFVGTGALSSFTTYSTFVGDGVALGTVAGSTYVAASYALGLAAAAVGILIGGRV